MFQDISEAYEVLSDNEMRAKYDRGEPVFENQGHQGGGRHHMDPNMFFQQHFRHGGGGGNRVGSECILDFDVILERSSNHCFQTNNTRYYFF